MLVVRGEPVRALGRGCEAVVLVGASTSTLRCVFAPEALTVLEANLCVDVSRPLTPASLHDAHLLDPYPSI